MNTTTVIATKPLQFTVGTSVAYIWGAQDAACRMPCLPEMYFVSRKDQLEYARGHESVAGATPLSTQLLSRQ